MDYQYKDQHFSVEIAETLILEKTKTTGASIEVIEKHLLDIHVKSGGFRPEEEDDTIHYIVMGALQNCQKKAKASCIRRKHPRWRVATSNQWIFGTGKHWVYLYYFPEDKQNAESNGKSRWQCRIGKTDGVDKNSEIVFDAPETRVNNQVRNYRQKPITALLIRVDRHGALETAIQKILTLRERKVRNAPATPGFGQIPVKCLTLWDILISIFSLPSMMFAQFDLL